MPVNEEQLKTDLEFLTQTPRWTSGDENQRREYVREVAVESAKAQDPEQHHALTAALWEQADPRGWVGKSADFIGRSVKEVAASAAAAGPAMVFAASDAAGLSDTGSGMRLKRGLADLGNATIQTVKQLAPHDEQQNLAETLDALREDIHNDAVPQGVKTWLAGGKPSADDVASQQYIHYLTHGLADKAAKADTRLQFNPGLRSDIVTTKSEQELRDSWLQSDRNPANVGVQSDGSQIGARDHLADYMVTRDPGSWQAFVNRVTETESQHKTRVGRSLTGEAQAMKVADQMGVQGDLLKRGLDMQTSPIDMATSILPVMRGMRLLKAVQGGAEAGSVLTRVGKGMAEEALQEGVTQKLQDARASNADVLEAAGMGAIGSGTIEGTMATVGHFMRDGTTLAKPPLNGTDGPSAPAENRLPVAGDRDRTGKIIKAVQDMGNGNLQVNYEDGSASSGKAILFQPLSANVTEGSPTEAAGSMPTREVPGDAGSTPAVGAPIAEPVPVPAPVAPVQRRMAERTLVSQGVEAEVAAAMVDHLGITPDMAPEALRDHVLNTFQEQGGQLPDSLPKRHLDQPAAYEAMGYTPEESQTHADNSRAIHEQDVQAAHEANRAVVTKLAEAAAARVAESQARPVAEPVRAPGVLDDPSNAAFDQQAAALEAKLGAAQDNRFANSNDPRLSSDLKPGNLPADVASPPEFTDAEATQRVADLERSLRANGELPQGSRLKPVLQARLDQLDQRARASLNFARAIAGVFGRRIVVVDGLGPKGRNNGVTNSGQKDTIFLNVNAPSWHATAGHELLHHLQVFEPKLYAQLSERLKPLLQRMDVAAKNYPGYSAGKELNAEVFADFLADSFHDPKFWDSLSQKQPGLFMPLARAVWGWFGKVLTALKVKGWESSQYFTDLNAARERLAQAVAEFAHRSQGRMASSEDAVFRTVQTENFFSGKQDMQRPSPDDIAESMAARVQQLQSAEEALQDGWNLTRSTEMERTRDGEPIIPTAYAVRRNADMQDAGREWTNHFLEASAMKGVADAKLGEHLLDALRTGRNPHTGRAMSGDVTAAILHSLADRVHELGIDRRAYELALQENASRAGHNLQSFRDAWDPITKLKTDVDAKTETELQQVTGGKDAATVTKELGEEVTREVAAEVRDVLDGARDDIADTAGAMPGSNLDQWLRGEGQQPVTLDMLVRQHLQTGRWAGERFQAAVRRLFPQLDAATATRITDAIHTALEAKDDGSHAGKRQEQRMSKAETIAGRWINKFAVSQSDTLSWSDPAKRAAHPLTVLIRAHLKELKNDFRARAQELGASAEQARVLDMEIREEHRRKAMIKSTQERTRIEAARQRAIERYMKGFEPGAKKANRWAGYSTFVKKLVQAGDLGILDSQAFLDAFSLTYKLHGITAERVTRLKEMHDRIIATGEDGRPLLYGSVRETVEREFAQLLNTIAPAQSWMKFVDGQLTAGMLSGISTMVNQFSGVVRVFAGINALADAWQYRGLNPARAAQQWLGELRSLWDSKGLFATAIRGESLGIAPPELLKMSPREQQTQLLKPGEKLRVGKRELPGVVSTLARLREMYVWRFIRGAEGLSGVSDASRQFENLLIEHYRQTGMTAEEAARKAANDVHGSEAARAAAREQAQQEQQTAMIGKGEGALNKRVREIIQHRLDMETGAQLTQRSEWLTSYWQFKTEPVSALGHGIAAAGRLLTGPETLFGGKVPNVARFMIKFTRFLGHSFETGFHYVPGLHLLTKLHGEVSGVRESEVKRVFGGRTAYNQMVDARAFAGFSMMLAMGGLSALALAMRRRDDEEPFFTITGTAPFESFETKQRLSASGKWDETQVRMFGKPILNYGQVPELAAIFSIIGNLNDHARFGNTLGHLGEKDGHAPKELGQRVWEQGVDLGLAPVRRSTFRNMFEIVNALLSQDTTAPDKLAKFATAPLGAAMKLPVLTDVDRAMRTMEGPRRNQGWANNALRQVPFVIVGDKMINAYGQQVPGFGFLSAVPITAPTFDPEAPSSRAAQLNLDTNTRRSTPDGPRLRNIVGQVVKLPAEEVAAFQQRAGKIYTRALLSNEAILRSVYHQQGVSAAQKIVSRLSEEANRQARAEQGW